MTTLAPSRDSHKTRPYLRHKAIVMASPSFFFSPKWTRACHIDTSTHRSSRPAVERRAPWRLPRRKAPGPWRWSPSAPRSPRRWSPPPQPPSAKPEVIEPPKKYPAAARCWSTPKTTKCQNANTCIRKRGKHKWRTFGVNQHKGGPEKKRPQCCTKKMLLGISLFVDLLQTGVSQWSNQAMVKAP